MFRNAGFAAIAAIFILVVLAGLGVVMVTLSTTQQRSAAFDIQGVQAYQAARAGIEFGAFRTLTTGGLVAANDCTPAIGAGALAPTTTFVLNGYTVNVACIGTSHAEVVTAPPINVYNITVTACNRAACPAVTDATYVERDLRITVGTNPP
jgi:MSHA biogenesis protein MshP